MPTLIKKTNCKRCLQEIQYLKNIPFYCKDCKPVIKNEQRRIRYKEQPEKRKIINNCSKQYAKNNSVKISEYLKSWRKSDAGIASYNKYKKTSSYKQKIKRRRLLHREKINNVIHKITLEEWYNMRKCGICFNCKQHFYPFELEMDHIYPISKANKDFIRTGIKRIYTINDIQPLCKKCNNKKGDKLENFEGKE